MHTEGKVLAPSSSSGNARPATRWIHLDALRGVLALLVVMGHIRGFVLVDFHEVQNPNLMVKAFYAVGGVGHDAVLAFFALSGFLVGGPALQAMLSGRWTWRHYLVARLARLWVVALPGLLLTWVVDRLGSVATGGAGYDGRYWGMFSSGPGLNTHISLDAMTFLGNVFFLQTILVPVFGSNGPLWSLANEFWYYMLFPLLGWALLHRGAIAARAVALLLVIGGVCLLPGPMIWLGLIWGAGAILALVLRLRRSVTWVTGLVLGTSALVLGSLAHLYRGTLTGDILEGLAWACLLPPLTGVATFHGVIGVAYAHVATWLSEISYTLYLIHFPILFGVYLAFLAPAQWQPGLPALSAGLLLLVIALGCAGGVWWLFERNTHKFGTAMMQVLKSGVRS